MACRGCYFALTPQQLAKLEAIAGTEERAEYLDSLFDDQICLDLDKSWYGMHRSLANIPPRGEEGVTQEDTEAYGTYPLKLAVMGGRNLNTDDNDGWIMRVIDADHVGPVAEAMQALDEAAFSERYEACCRDAYPEYGEEDRDYTWAYFTEARDFLRQLAGSGNVAVFLADQ